RASSSSAPASRRRSSRVSSGSGMAADLTENLLSSLFSMAISRNTQSHLAKGDFAALEGEWLSSVEEAPTGLDYFVGVARALVGNGQEGRARDLLEMLDEQLRE